MLTAYYTFKMLDIFILVHRNLVWKVKNVILVILASV